MAHTLLRQNPEYKDGIENLCETVLTVALCHMVLQYKLQQTARNRIINSRLFAVRLGYSEKQVVRTLHTSKSMPVYMKYFSERITLSFPGGRPRL